MKKTKDLCEAIIFDLDGVIVNSNESVTLFWENIATRYGRTLTPKNIERFILGCTVSYSLDKLFPEMSLSDRAKIQSELDNYENLLEYQPMPNAINLIDNLVKIRCPLALVTSGSNSKARKVLENLNIANCFSTIITNDDVRLSKPHPEGFLLAATRLNISALHCIVFEDSKSGLDAAYQAGMICIGVRSLFETNTPPPLWVTTVIQDCFPKGFHSSP